MAASLLKQRPASGLQVLGIKDLVRFMGSIGYYMH